MQTTTPTRGGLRGLALTAALGAMALASAGSAAAQTYEWSPQKTNSRLTGTLLFIPTDGHGAQFQCRVTLSFRTGNAKRGADDLPQIVSATFKGRRCETVRFTDLPWYVGADNASFGSLSRFGWIAGTEGCEAPTGASFGVDAKGTWNFNNGGAGFLCLIGTLTSNPPVTIVPKP